MSLRMQGLLLRFLETGELQKVGDRVGTRVGRQNHRRHEPHLRQMVTQGQFARTCSTA
jgi:transcriptional regulator of aromatic amino acid metabolism